MKPEYLTCKCGLAAKVVTFKPNREKEILCKNCFEDKIMDFESVTLPN